MMTRYATQNHLAGVHLLDKKDKVDNRGRNGHHKVPDEIILSMRRMHEIERRPHSQVAAAFPDYSIHYVRDVLNYILRAHLKP